MFGYFGNIKKLQVAKFQPNLKLLQNDRDWQENAQRCD